MRRFGLLAAALVPALSAAGPESFYKCTTPAGSVVYQEQPCESLPMQKRFGYSTGTADEAKARRSLEAGARRGEPLSAGFVDELRERDRREAREREERLRAGREERLRAEREKAAATPPEPPEWNPAWGWPGPPGLARPKPTPAK